MNQNLSSPAKSQKRKTSLGGDNFLEALKSLGEDVIGSLAHDVVGGVAQETFNQIFKPQIGNLEPNQSLKFDQFTAREAIHSEEKLTTFTQEFLDIRQQEKLVFSQKEQQVQLQISAILEELKKLALSTQNLAKEVKVASAQVPVKPGKYHLSFFDRLRQTLVLLRQKIDNSAAWLASFNQRSKKRNAYWGQFKKSGTKFLLSQERYMSTQAG